MLVLASESLSREMPRILALSLISSALVPCRSFATPVFSSISRSTRDGREASGTKRTFELEGEIMERRRGEWRRSRFLLMLTDSLWSKPVTSWMVEFSEKKESASSWVLLIASFEAVDVPWTKAIFELVLARCPLPPKKNTFTFTQKQTKFRCLHDNICRTTTQEDSVSVLNVLNQLKRRRLWVEGQTEPQAPDTQWGPMIDPESSPGKTQSCLSMNFLMGGWQLVWL